jgi:amino acid permease
MQETLFGDVHEDGCDSLSTTLLSPAAQSPLRQNRFQRTSTPAGSPEAHAPGARVGTVPGAIFNMSNSILGGGISLLALPSAVAAAGPALFVVLLVGSGVATILSAQLLAEAAEHAGVTSYDALGATALGKVGSTAVMVFIFLNNFGVCISFLQGFGDVVPELVQTAVAAHHRHDTRGNPLLLLHNSTVADGSDAEVSRPLLTLLLLLPLLPVMITLTRIEHLQSLSLVALVLVLLFVGFIITVFAENGSAEGAGSEWSRIPTSIIDTLNAVATISFCFACK